MVRNITLLASISCVVMLVSLPVQAQINPHEQEPIQAQEKTSTPQSQTQPASIVPPALATIKPDDISRFCSNIDETATEAHFELRRRELENLRGQVDGRIEILEQKRREYEIWLKKRDDFLSRTHDSFVGILSKMRPDAASAQLALVDDMVVASIMLKLKPATASIIMNELPAEKAANITHILASAQKLPVGKTKAHAVPPVEQ